MDKQTKQLMTAAYYFISSSRALLAQANNIIESIWKLSIDQPSHLLLIEYQQNDAMRAMENLELSIGALDNAMSDLDAFAPDEES